MLRSEVRIGLTYGKTYHPNTQKYIILRYVTRCSQIITPSYYLETTQILPAGSARIIVTQVCGTALPFPLTGTPQILVPASVRAHTAHKLGP